MAWARHPETLAGTRIVVQASSLHPLRRLEACTTIILGQLFLLAFLALLLLSVPRGVAGEALAPPVRELVRAWVARDQPLPALAYAAAETARAPRSAPAWAGLAAALFRNGDFEAAEHAAERALALEPEDPDALVALARCLRTRGLRERAAECLARAVRNDPAYPAALRLYAGSLDLNTERAKTLDWTGRYVNLERPWSGSECLFRDHCRRMLEIIRGLGETPLNAQPPWDERPERVVAPLETNGDGPAVVVAFGEHRAHCLFDTGEESVTLTPETARALGARTLAEMPAATATGVERMKLVLVPHLALGAFKLENVLASIGTSDIVGPGLFDGYRVKADFARRELVLTRQERDAVPAEGDLRGAPEGFRRARFRNLGGMAWVPVAMPDEAAPLHGRPAWGCLDTGCGPPCVLLPRYYEALRSEPGKAPLALPLKTTLAGAAEGAAEQLVQVFPRFSLLVLGLEANADRALSAASLAPISRFAEAELDVVVGWPILSRNFKSIELDYARCVLTLEDRAAHARR